MRLDKIILENFLTYDSLEYNIPNKPLLVQGINSTEEDQASNGSGKSGMFTAIEYCIASTNSRGVKDSELVSFGHKESNIELYASCDVRKESLHIHWKIKLKGSNVLTLRKKNYDGNWNTVSFSNVNDGKKFVLNWFAIEKEDLFNYYIINKSRFKSFFKASNKEKVDLINRFSDASIIDGLDKLDNSILENEYEILKTNLDKILGKIELLNDNSSSTDDTLQDFQQKNKIRVSEIKKEIKELKVEKEEFQLKLNADSKKLDEENNKLESINVRVTQAQELVDKFKMTNFDDEIDNHNDELDSYEDKSIKVSTLVKELNIELGGSIECPKCSHEFTVDSKHGTLEEVKSKLEKAEVINININDKIKELEEGLANINEKIEKERNNKQIYIDSLNNIKEETFSTSKIISRLKEDILEHKNDLSDIDNDIKECKLEIKEIESSELVDNSDKIKELTKDKIEAEGLYNSKGDEIYNRNKWKNNFKQFRMHLANQSLEAIEFHMNRYLNEMNSDLKVKMEGFKMLANGTFKDEITAKIIRNVERTFSSFSGGEQGRLLFAAILANRYMINSTHPYGGLDFLSIDEVFEGVDSLGLKQLVKSAKLLNVAVMIITHVTDEEVNDDVLTIEKVNGISYVKK